MQGKPVKKRIFGVTAVLLPFLLLAIVECLLRLSGFERARQDLFITVPDHENQVVINPCFAGRYFSGFLPDVAPQPFLREKPSDTRRYFVLGGSSAAGFPYHFYNGFPAYLEELLQAVAPDRQVEVINLAMTAVNSYTLRDMHRQLLRHDPDGILIYAGHNEYYGAYGAAVVPGWMRPRVVRRTMLGLMRLHLVSWVTGLAERLTGGALSCESPSAGTGPGSFAGTESSAGPRSRTLMARMAGKRLVYRDDARYAEGVRHFEENIADILVTFRREGIPVYLSTVVSNKAGQKPLADDPEADRLYGMGVRAGSGHEAQQLFHSAKELDPLRFRAPEAVNEAIRHLAGQQGVRLIDAHRLQIPNRIPFPYDQDYFTDHLHPDHRGYGLLAAAFMHAIHKDAVHEHAVHEQEGGMEKTRASGSAETPHSTETERYRMIIPKIPEPDPLEKILVEHTIAVLKSDFPFERDPQKRDPVLLHRERMHEMQVSVKPAERSAYQHLSAAHSPSAVLGELAGRYRVAGDHHNAVRVLRALHYRQPLNPALDDRIRLYLHQLAASRSPSELGFILPLLIRMETPVIPNDIWLLITEILIESGRFDQAYSWLQVWEEHNNEYEHEHEHEHEHHADYYRLHALWYIRQGEHETAQPWFREYYRRIR